jgi:DNA-binding MarR family transcriptional regulator
VVSLVQVEQGERKTGLGSDPTGSQTSMHTEDVDASSEAAIAERLLTEISLSIVRKGRDILGEFDVTPPQFHALLALKENGEMAMGELCQAMFLACSTVTDLTERMQRYGYVTRMKDPKDRRVMKVKLEGYGRAVIDRVLQERRRYVGTLLEKLSEDEKDCMFKTLDRLRHVIDSSPTKNE